MATVQPTAVPSSDHSLQSRLDSQAARTLTVFAFLWAVFTFFHQSKWEYWTRTPIESLQTAVAIAVLFRPSNLGAFLALVVIQMVDLMYTMPHISNHSIFAMFVNMTIAVAAFIEIVRHRGLPLDRGRLLRLFAPAVRLEVFGLYFWVVVHKLNTDFLSPESSCAVDHYQHLSGLLARGAGVALPDSSLLLSLTVWLTLVIEAGIPILLVWKRTRVAGVMLGLLFHFMLGVNIFHDFSGMVFALYLLFLPSNFVDEAKFWLSSASAKVRLAGHQVLGTVPLPVWVAVGALALLLVTGNSWGSLHRIFFRLWLIYGALYILLFLAVVYARRSHFEQESGAFRTHPVLLLFPIVVLLNGFLPYLGLKTENSFSMFSNLRTEGGKSNHLFIPASLQVFDFQKDMVTILRSSNSGSENANGYSMPYVALVDNVRRLRARGMKNIELTYTRGGVEYHTANAESDPELTRRYPWYVRKLQRFRRVDNEPRQPCRH